MKTAILVLMCVLLSSCTIKLSGETSIMKQWDRPAESTTTSTSDTSTNANVVVTPHPVTVPNGVKLQSPAPVVVK